jgi:hypothetical protein
MIRKIGLLATGRKKASTAAPIVHFYKSPLFQKSVQYARKHYDRFYFYNAKDGLLLPDQVMEPYDLSIKTFTIKEKKQWAKNLISGFSDLESAANSHVYLHGGKIYRDHLEPELRLNGYQFETPMQGLGIGKQLAWYDQQLKNI